jgi:uncharacterized protein (DUF1015 family)
MAEIKPFRAWRYNNKIGSSIADVVSPLFDVVTADRLGELYMNPLNSIHLSVPDGGPSKAGKTLEDWKNNGTLVMDELPGIYIYYQFYKCPFNGSEKCRKGFACNIRVHEWSEKVILHHENTIPGSVTDRLEILAETGFHASPTHGLYSDPQNLLEHWMDEAITEPVYTNESDGIREIIGVIHDHSVIQEFVRLISEKQIILADGHHRFEASIQHARMRRASGDLTPEFHLMYLSNISSGDLTILPTHRMVDISAALSEPELLEKLSEDFELTPVSSVTEGEKIIAAKPEAFIMVSANNSIRLDLKKGLAIKNPWPFPENILRLDLTILHYFILEKIFGIPGAEQRKSGKIKFERSPETILKAVREGKAAAGFITRPVSINSVFEVCESGFTLPQKSTWFYPKLNSGYFFSSVLPGESRLPDFVRFQ